MNNIFPTKLKIIPVAVWVGGLTLLANQPVYAEPPYKVNGNSVDKATYNGWNIYRAEACGSCHEANAEGNVSNPNLLHSFKTLTKEQFHRILIDGRGTMYSFKNNKVVVDGIDDLYAYLKGRSDGVIPAGDLKEIK